MNHLEGERLISTTALLAMGSLATVFLWAALVGGVPWMDALRRSRGERTGLLVFAAVLGFMSGVMALTMLGSRDAVERHAPFAVAAVLAAGVAAASARMWTVRHGKAGLTRALDSWMHAVASLGTLVCLAVALGLVVMAVAPAPAGLAGFLVATSLLLGLATGSYFVRYGWNPGRRWFPVPIFVTRGPSRPAGIALRDGWREYRALTPKARVALKEASLAPFLWGLGGLFTLCLPAVPLTRLADHSAVAGTLLMFVFGLMGGAVFIPMLPVMLLLGFAFAFILLPLGLLRVTGGASGGAGASAEI